MRKILKRSFKYISCEYEKRVNSNIKPASAEEWLVDNFYIIEDDAKSLMQSLKNEKVFSKKKKEAILPKAYEYLRENNLLVSESDLSDFLSLKQKEKPFSLSELEIFPETLKVAVISEIADMGLLDAQKMSNAIKSLCAIRDIDWKSMFANQSVTDKILSSDSTYKEMCDESKNYYRKKIKNLSQTLNVPEEDIASRAIELCKNKKEKEGHVGYYLLSGGKSLLYKSFGKKLKKRHAKKIYFLMIALLTAFILSPVYIYTKSILGTILAFLPIFDISINLVNYAILKVVPQRHIPRIQGETCKKTPLLVIYPVLLGDKKNAQKMCKNMEVAYLANKSENISFALVGDFRDADKKEMPSDNEIISTAKECIASLNQKHGEHFYLLFRERTFNPVQKKWLGRERKRGAIEDLNRFLRGKYSFKYTQGNTEEIKGIKYVLTLDADTFLPKDAALKLLGAMLHPLNKPKVKNGVVCEGYAIIEPRISTELLSSNKSFFASVYAGQGGVDTYSSTVPDIYTDLFGESVFTGKGIYDSDVFAKCMDSKVPDNTVLSHDLLESCYCRCALASDIEVYDGFPHNFLSYTTRMHRWIRGDWQIITWLADKKLSGLSKWKIFDNLRRSINPAFLVALIVFACSFLFEYKFVWILTALISLTLPMLLYLFDAFLSKSYIYIGDKINADIVYGVKAYIYQSTLSVILLAYTAVISLNAAFLGLYRRINKTKALEWVTAQDADKGNKDSLYFYYKKMLPSVAISVVTLLLSIIFLENTMGISLIFAIIWAATPCVAWLISKEKKETPYHISEKQKDSLYEIASRIWRFFDRYMNEGENYLPPDNVQINPYKGVAHRTSPTNIGFGMLSVLCALDLGFINKNEMINRLCKMTDTIEKLEKWKGNLYNWYDTKTLKPLKPRYVSTVDSGNFICYLLTVSQGVREYGEEALAKRLEKIADNTQLSPLYSEKKELFSIGYNADENCLTNSYYDLLASEARATSFISVARGEVPQKHWFRLGRSLTTSNGYKGLVSWTGTMFEYLMPNIVMKKYKNTLLAESYWFTLFCQKRYGKKRHIPWGISESGYYSFDADQNYQYKAFGIPELGLKHGLSEDAVIAPYATMLALMEDTGAALENMQKIEKLGALSEYGFFEAIDFSPKDVQGTGIVKSYMAHHQGMSLASICNVLKDNILQKRFHDLSLVQSAEPLLKERVPVRVRITKEYKERLTPIKTEKILFEECVRVYENKLMPPPLHNLSNGSYNVIVDTNGNGYSSIGNIRFNKFYHNPAEEAGQLIFIKKDGKIISAYSGETVFTNHKAEYTNTFGNMSIKTSVCVLPEVNAESRRVTITNKGADTDVEVYFYTEISLAKLDAQLAHKAFSDMFVKCENDGNVFYAERRKRSDSEKTFVGYTLPFFEGECKKLSHTSSREEFLGRGNSVYNAKAFSKEKLLNTPSHSPCFAYKAVINIKNGESASVTFVSGMEETKKDAEKAVSIIKNIPPSQMEHNAYESVHSMVPYLYKNEYQNAFSILPGIIWSPFLSNQKTRALQERNYTKAELWKYGISGDFPIILFDIASEENIPCLKEILKIHKYLLRRTIVNDLVIFCNLPKGYTNPLEEVIKKNAGNTGRVYIVNDKKAMDVLLAASCVYIDALSGISSFPESLLLENKDIKQRENNDEDILTEKLEFQNKWGGFSGNDYVIYLKDNEKTPAPWINVIANKDFGFIASENGGGYTFYKNCHEQRITEWENDEVRDPVTEILSVSENDDIWSPMSGAFSEKGNYLVRHGFGFTEYSRNTRGIHHKVTEFVPLSAPAKIIKTELLNRRNTEVKLKVAYSLCPVLGENSYKTRGLKKYAYVKNGVSAENAFSSFKVELTSSNGKGEIINAYTKKRVGDNTAGGENIISVFEEITLKPKEKATIIFNLGICNRESLNAEEEFKKVLEYYKNLFGTLKVNTPSSSMNLMLNGRLMYQTLASRLFARTGFYQSGGAFGFRDQLQDVMAFMYANPEIAKKQILLHASHQFEEGDALHWWHSAENPKGVRTRISDDRLWLPYVTQDYIKITGDTKILEEEIPYLSAPVLKEGEEERYAEVSFSTKKGTLKEHCEKAIEISKTKGEHGLPLIGTGDWNDGMNNVLGESVWLAWFISVILSRFNMDNNPFKSAGENSWDGQWYRRAYYEDGTPIGSKESEECKIDSITQSWSVFAGAKNAKKAMDAVYENLFDKENKIIKILDPPFEKCVRNPGYIKSYPAGVRENGGQYTHAAVWACIAEAILGNNERAMQYFDTINPINKDVSKYKKEPYALCADVYSKKGFEGVGGWSWYTGAASWLYRAGIEYILGMKKEGDKITFSPCVPSSWKSFSLSYKFFDTEYNFTLSKGENKTGQITLVNDKKTHNIEVIY